MKKTIRLGAGSGFSGDRIDPAVTLADRADLDYLVFECLGERTVAAGNARRLADPDTGYDPLLLARIRAVLPHVLRRGTTVVTNGGAAHPLAAARRIADLVGGRARVAAVTGDDVLDAVRTLDPLVWETGKALSAHPEKLVSANAYIGADAVLPALSAGADIVVTGRLADPSLYVAPLVHEFGWDLDDARTIGAATAVGHLLECAGQLTGGYYADPVTKPVPGMADLGFPYADVSADADAVFGKVDGTGGTLTTRTATEQLLYEVGDPTTYLTPDVTADFRAVTFEQVGPDRVSLTGATGRTRPDELKVTLGFLDGWIGEGQISYAGPRAYERARLAADIVTQRLADVHGLDPDGVTVELIGAGAAFRGLATDTAPTEVRLRVTGRAGSREDADVVGWEVESLYTNGPAGGGGARRSHAEVLCIRSTSLPRHLVHTEVHLMEGTR
ncbi:MULTISPECIES: acyclic terpene utilization AtuA family protein [unclassified Rhodococcus (in: high G+C Gram-positive bacteria)]|uniref:acyclic terpene utilization AtuA family protein n=1 Tax=unclassified Rhodococcus (in: high G+C Gram-positive bacteria) TaxID=192944 RepID=UPI0006F357AD|nr:MULTISPECIES: acyclic terpene utilization AtuA family protein [unclassified Rhodococcus (in: high G+C Gram-positive bacteria)]KQU36533.1 ABC transporter substrate-binding protein [Rhodococcus sp. Leaf225]KQU47590.1 ABC transporter substrate-binding protein [Rhodococcus sp. Leaf258]